MPHIVPNDILIPQIAALMQEGKEVLFTPTGNSMRPFIEGGRDTVAMRKQEPVRVGDICLAQINSTPRYVLHRVIAVSPTDITLMGDGNLTGIEHCPPEMILGTVTRILTPKGRPKPLTRGRLWYHLKDIRWLLLKIHRKTIVKLLKNNS